MAVQGYDFCGWATKNDLKCADGRIIRKNAFKVNDGTKVPLVWNHQRTSVDCTLGHAILENRDEGVYVYGFFNDTTAGKDAKEIVKHGDIESLSIFANNLEQMGSEVIHGIIREVSLVLAGANPGAFIESVLAHGEPMEDGDDEGIFYTGSGVELEHAEDEPKKEEKPDGQEKSPKEKTVGEVMNTLSEEQKKAVAIVIGQAIEDSKNGEDEEEEDGEMKHNLFEGKDQQESNTYISHADVEEIFANAKRLGSLKEAIKENIANDGVLAHALPLDGMTAATGTQTYGFNDPSMLFPDYKTVGGETPEWLSRNMDWVQKLMGSIHHTPFSRIKSVYANITEDDARARGYIKGKQKKEEVFTTLKRTTDPQTIYKKQKLDRDDVVDITGFDVVAWIRNEMRLMLNEEIARAILIGDGRPSDSDDKIQEAHVRPIAKDVDLFNVKVAVNAGADAGATAEATIDAIIRARKNYKGSGNPIFFTTEDTLTEMLMLKDKIGHRIYKTEAELATTLRVREIVTVEVMEGQKTTINKEELPLIGVIVNPADYNVGADKGGEINNFEDFDIDYNQMKYLIETRISGALIKPFSAITIGLKSGTSPDTPVTPEIGG